MSAARTGKSQAPGMSLAVLLLAGLLAGCVAVETRSWGEYAAPGTLSLAPSQAATFDWSERPGIIASIDGISEVRTGYKSARLAPGLHNVAYEDLPVEFGVHPSGSMELDLKPGHGYRFGIKYCFSCVPRRYAVWVDDLTTGELAWGSRPNWKFRAHRDVTGPGVTGCAGPDSSSSVSARGAPEACDGVGRRAGTLSRWGSGV